MCNKGIACLSQSENTIDRQHPHQAVYLMDSPSATPNWAPNYAMSPGSNDDSPRIKFLCSFLGSILPRPQDGKLRYVGGETRIVSVHRDITYEELMNKMRELYEGAAVLKYQQPDEDLDALVSVVNDDDVTNMMEEYDKLGSGDGFTRLRIFLFSHPDQDGSSHYDGDERDTERRYVDALNNLNDGSDIRKQQPDSPVISALDDGHSVDQFFNPLSLEGGLHNQRNELPIPPYNLHHLTIPHMGSGQHHQPISQRYSEMEAPWSPAYYSPRHHGHHDPRTLVEFPSSPSARYCIPFVDLPDKCSDRMPEEFSRQQVSPLPAYEHQPQYSDNVGWLPTGAVSGEKSGFPGNIFQASNVLEGSSICEHCRMTFQRNQPHFEHPSMGSGLHQVANPCPDCPPNREAIMLNADTKLHHGIYPNEQSNEHRSLINDSQKHERGWILHQQLNARADETRINVSGGGGRLNDQYTVDGPGLNLPLGHANMVDGRHVSSNYIHHRAGPELGNEVFHDQALPGAPLIHIPPPEESGIRYGNHPFAYGGDNLYPAHGHVPGLALWRNVQNPMNVAPSYEASNAPPQVNGKINPGFPRGTWEGSPRFCIGVDNQNPWVESSQKMLGFDGKAVPDYAYGHALKVNPNILGHENQHQFSPDPVRPSQEICNCDSPLGPINDLLGLEGKSIPKEKTEDNHLEKTDNCGSLAIPCSDQSKVGDNNCEVVSLESINSNCLKTTKESRDDIKPYGKDLSASPDVSKLSVSRLSFLPELIASVKKAALEGAEEVKAEVKESADNDNNVSTAKETAAKELESGVRTK